MKASWIKIRGLDQIHPNARQQYNWPELPASFAVSTVWPGLHSCCTMVPGKENPDRPGNARFSRCLPPASPATPTRTAFPLQVQRGKMELYGQQTLADEPSNVHNRK
jgi:hypothetical protein